MTESAENPYETGEVPDPSDLWTVDPNTTVEEWTDENDPLSLDELADVAAALIDECGTAAREESEEGTIEDEYLRVADDDAFGRFAYEHDVALLEPGDAVRSTYGYLYGYTTNANTAIERGVPLLVCLPGPLPDAVEWFEEFSAAVSDMPGLGIVRP